MRYHVDGFLLSGTNPSPLGGGYCIVTEDGKITKKSVKKPMSNNTAEIMAILEALRICNSGDKIYTDSRVALGWTKTGKIKSDKVFQHEWTLSMVKEANTLYIAKEVQILWVGREFNMAGITNEFKNHLNTEEDILYIFNEADRRMAIL